MLRLQFLVVSANKFFKLLKTLVERLFILQPKFFRDDAQVSNWIDFAFYVRHVGIIKSPYLQENERKYSIKLLAKPQNCAIFHNFPQFWYVLTALMIFTSNRLVSFNTNYNSLHSLLTRKLSILHFAR